MSAHNAALSLPPGDRDDAPSHVVGPETDAPTGRKPMAAMPDLDADIRALEQAIGEAQFTLGELKLARTQNNLPSAKAAALRLCQTLVLIDLRAIASRIKRSLQTQRRGADQASAA